MESLIQAAGNEESAGRMIDLKLLALTQGRGETEALALEIGRENPRAVLNAFADPDSRSWIDNLPEHIKEQYHSLMEEGNTLNTIEEALDSPNRSAPVILSVPRPVPRPQR